ncbi:MAG TPA: hypothetical protein PLT15_04855 [Bacilli bacterium]|nr:hypothetical protein [Bacilli bacterium]HQD93018.1 hypothetical protein [Bacilli bacterium]
MFKVFMMFTPLLKPLVYTILLELLTLVFLKQQNFKIYGICLLINIITNVIINIMLQEVAKYYYLLLMILEIIIVFIESTGYYIIKKDYFETFRVLFFCHFISFLIGSLINYL